MMNPIRRYMIEDLVKLTVIVTVGHWVPILIWWLIA